MMDLIWIAADEVCIAIHVDERGNGDKFEIYRLVRTVGTKDMRKNNYMTVKNTLPMAYSFWGNLKSNLPGHIVKIWATTPAWGLFWANCSIHST